MRIPPEKSLGQNFLVEDRSGQGMAGGVDTTEDDTAGTGTGRGVLPRGLILAAGVAGALLLLAVTHRFGPGITPDSVEYFAAAENLVSGLGLLSYDMNPMVEWPPLYPALLALGHAAGMDVVVAARYVNSAAYGAVILVSGVLLSGAMRRAWLAFIGLVAVAALYPLFLVSAFALSEPLFILLTLLFLLAAGEYLKAGKMSWLALAAAFAAIACLCRYIGVTVVLTGLLLLLARRGAGLPRKALDAAIFALVSLAPLAAWLYRNYIVSHSLTGERGPSRFGFMENVSYALDVFSGWFIPEAIPSSVRITVFLWVAVVLALSLERSRGDGPPVTHVLLFFLIYTGFLVASSTAAAFDRIDNRLLSPAGAPLVLLSFYMLDNLKTPLGAKLSERAMGAFTLILSVTMLVFPLVRSGYAARDFAGRGPGGYSGDSWKKSELIGYLKSHRPKTSTFSNAPDAVYLLTGICAAEGPIKHLYNSAPAVPEYLERFRQTVQEKGAVRLIWFDDAYGDHFYSPEELGGDFNVRLDKNVSDGAVYVLRPKKDDAGKTF